MRIGIDFDRVIIDTDELDKQIKEETGLCHVEADVFDEQGNYSPRKHAEACGVDVEEVCNQLEDITEFVYDDVDELEQLGPEYDLVLVTRGRKEYQKRKLDRADVKHLFDEIYILPESLEERPKDDSTGIDFLVDDLEEEVERVDVPGMVFDREEQSMQDVVDRVEEL
ncbi:MAG: hypothetical protein ABEJ83_04040 [Candidatus Nanohaloarchaea archaeon]